MRTTVILIFFGALLSYAHGLKILGVFPIAAYSHYSLGFKLMKELAHRGHDVKMIASFKEKDPIDRFETIELTGFSARMEEVNKQFNPYESLSVPALLMLYKMISFSYELTQEGLEHPNVKTLLASNEKFDVIILEQFMNEASRGLCHHFNAPCVIFNSVSSSYWTNIMVGNPANPAYIPEMLLNHVGPMSLYQRLKNTLLSSITHFSFHNIVMPYHNALMQKIFKDAPPLEKLYYETPLILLNSHVSTAQSVPLLPNMKEIGGFHVEPPKILPKELQKYLDDAKEGVIYFSMGSNLKSKDMKPEKLQALMKTFARLNQKILWKFETNLLEKPDNVRIEKWLPQQDILAHPNVKVFITHGGLLSTIEAIYHAVPVVGLPVYGDQATNMLHAVHGNYGISIKYIDLDEHNLFEAIQKILTNPVYKENAKLKSNLLNDQPMKPIDTAMFWIEYVARHKGALYFRSAALDLAWYQYFLLDVIAVISLAVLVVALTVKCALKKLCNKKTCAESKKKKKTKQN